MDPERQAHNQNGHIRQHEPPDSIRPGQIGYHPEEGLYQLFPQPRPPTRQQEIPPVHSSRGISVIGSSYRSLEGILDLKHLPTCEEERATFSGMTDGLLCVTRSTLKNHRHRFRITNNMNPKGSNFEYSTSPTPRRAVSINMVESNITWDELQEPPVVAWPKTIVATKGIPVVFDVQPVNFPDDWLGVTVESGCSKNSHLPLHVCRDYYHNHEDGTNLPTAYNHIRAQPIHYIVHSDRHRTTPFYTSNYQHATLIHPSRQ
ncbi:unnamed protein product [Sphagnum tenellum]